MQYPYLYICITIISSYCVEYTVAVFNIFFFILSGRPITSPSPSSNRTSNERTKNFFSPALFELYPLRSYPLRVESCVEKSRLLAFPYVVVEFLQEVHHLHPLMCRRLPNIFKTIAGGKSSRKNIHIAVSNFVYSTGEGKKNTKKISRLFSW